MLMALEVELLLGATGRSVALIARWLRVRRQTSLKPEQSVVPGTVMIQEGRVILASVYHFQIKAYGGVGVCS